MTPTQALNLIASVLFERSGFNGERKIQVRLGYGNRLKPPSGLDDGNCDAGMAGGFISLWLNSSALDCKTSGFQKVEGKDAHVSEVIYDARITVHAQRCGSFDLLHRLKAEFCHPANTIDFGRDIIGTPEFGNIIDVSALADGDEFEDRAESVLTVRFRDRTAKILDCVTFCASEINKNQPTEQETLCH